MDKLIEILTKFYNAFVVRFDSCITCTTDIRAYTRSGAIVSSGCNSIEFYNQGDVDIIINDARLLKTGETFAVSPCVPHVRDTTNYMIVFDTNTIGINPQLVVTTSFVNISRNDNK